MQYSYNPIETTSRIVHQTCTYNLEYTKSLMYHYSGRKLEKLSDSSFCSYFSLEIIHIGSRGKKTHIQVLICALVCAPKLVCALICVLVCALNLVCALICD